jgi:hypothetical protein
MFTFLIFMTLLPGPGGPPDGFIALVWVFMLFFLGIWCAPSFVAAYGLLKRRRWAKIAAIVAGVVSASSAPIGTAVCAYTFWFLFSEPGKLLYDQPQYALPAAQTNWQIDQTRQREVQYTPPPSPPDWR